MAFWYSVRVSRRIVAVRPGFGFAAAARSSAFTRYAITLSYVASSGRVFPTGGIWRARSFRTTFSQTSGCRATS